MSTGGSTTALRRQELGTILYFHSHELGESNIDASATYLTHINMMALDERANEEVTMEPGAWMFVFMAFVFILVLKFGQKKPHIQKTEAQEKNNVAEKPD